MESPVIPNTAESRQSAAAPPIERTDEQPDHLVRLELREALRSLLRRAQVGERSAQRRRVGAGARAHDDADRGEHRERADVEEQEQREERVDESRSDQERLAAPAIAERPAGTWTSVLATSGPAMKIATATELPPRWATYSGAIGKTAATPVNMISCPISSQNAGSALRFPVRARTSVRAMPPFSGFGREPLDYDGAMAVGSTPVDDDLYREIILDHYRNPRHHQTVDPADRVIEANNPLCGDEIDLSYRLDNGTVAAIGFIGRGCSISQASASMLCEAVTGMSVEGAASLAERFRAMLTGDGSLIGG